MEMASLLQNGQGNHNGFNSFLKFFYLDIFFQFFISVLLCPQYSNFVKTLGVVKLQTIGSIAFGDAFDLIQKM